MSKIIVRKQEYANNGTHADEIKAVVRDDLVVNTLSSATDLVPSVGLVKSETDAIKDALSNLDEYEIPSADRLIGVSVFLRKRNGMVTLQTNGSNTVAVPSGGGTTICTLPEAYRPPMQLSCWQNVNGNYKAYFSVYPNGTFLVGFSAIPTGQNFQVIFNYVTAS